MSEVVREPARLRVSVMVGNLLLMMALCVGIWFMADRGSLSQRDAWGYDYDARHWYAGGVSWWRGESPYDKEGYTTKWLELYAQSPFQRSTFVYPPTMAVISLPMALLPWDLARWAFRVVSVLAFLGLCYVTWRLMETEGQRFPLLSSKGWYLVPVGYLASVTQCMFQGQTALIVAFGCVLAWYAWRTERNVLLALGLLLASIKPQISLLPLVFLFCLAPRRFALAALPSLLLAAGILLIGAERPTLAQYTGSLHNHLTYQDFNHWENYRGVPAILGSTPAGAVVLVGGVIVGLLFTVWVAWGAAQEPKGGIPWLRHAQLVWAAALALMPIHIYDRVGSVFLMITLWAIPGWWRRVVLVLLLWAADRPVNVQRVLGLAGEITAPIRPWVAQDGTPVLSGILLFVLCWWYWRDVLQAKIRATGTSGAAAVAPS
jgi:hypothetical protein